ncbi:MAG: winged helix-turn-helix domain-containing protein [Flavobacteriaceae bacterium]
MKKVSYYLLGLAILTLALTGLHLKGLFDAALLEKNKIDHQISAAVCNTFEQLSTDNSNEIDVRDCANLGNGSFQLSAHIKKDQLYDMINQGLEKEDQILFPFQISLQHSIGENDLSQSNLEFADNFQTALVSIDVPPLRNVILTGWGTEFLLIIIISSIMIWIYYNIIGLLLNKKSHTNTSELTPIQIGKYAFDVRNLALSINDKQRRITPKECQLLNYLYKRKNQITRRDDILMALWGGNDYFKGRSLDVFIARLRKYLSEDDTIKIETVHGVGFILIDK